MVTTQKNVQEVGREMCESKVVRKVSFTGSTAVAKSLYSMSASTMKRCVFSSFRFFCSGAFIHSVKRISIEAGGNAPFIVFDDADIEKAVEGSIQSSCRALVIFMLHRPGAIICKFRASGQTCVCANRIYVQSSVYADFASRLAEKVAGFKVGNGLDETTYVHSTRAIVRP